jgi:uncharacterized integral membrane protein
MSDDIADHAGAVHRHDFAQLLRWMFIAAIVVALVAVAMDNRNKVRVGYAVGHAQAPIGIVMIAAAAAGIIIGWLVRHRPRNRV